MSLMSNSACSERKLAPLMGVDEPTERGLEQTNKYKQKNSLDLLEREFLLKTLSVWDTKVWVARTYLMYNGYRDGYTIHQGGVRIFVTLHPLKAAMEYAEVSWQTFMESTRDFKEQSLIFKVRNMLFYFKAFQKYDVPLFCEWMICMGIRKICVSLCAFAAVLLKFIQNKLFHSLVFTTEI